MSINKSSLKVMVYTLVGMFCASVIWFVVYDLNFGVLEFDGPAAATLITSIVAGGVVFGLGRLVYELRKQKPLRLKLMTIFIAALLLGSFVISEIAIKVALQRYSNSPVENFYNNN